MNQTVETTIEQTIEYGGLTWERSSRCTEPEYQSKDPEVGEFRIFQYAEDSSCNGHWLWCAYLTKISPEIKFVALKPECSGIVETREIALNCCINARGQFLSEIQSLIAILNIGDYATGFRDGFNAMADQIKEVLP